MMYASWKRVNFFFEIYVYDALIIKRISQMNFKDIKYNNVDFSTMSLTIIQDFARVKLDKIMKYMCIRNFNVLYTHNESNYVYTGV